MIYGTMLGPLLLPDPISPHHSAIRLSSSLGPEEREREKSPFKFENEGLPCQEPIQGCGERFD